jgi:IclR family pca regulon transcriptional regulator
MRTKELSASAGVRLPNSYIHAFARGLAAIRAFGPQTPEMTLSQVAERSGLSRANARRILLTLEHLGYVTSRGRRFRLTARILDLGYAYLSSLSLSHIAQPVMEELADRVQLRCNVAVLDGHDIIYVARVSLKADSEAYPRVTIGRRFPAHATALGRVLLGAFEPDMLERFISTAELRALTVNTVIDPAVLTMIVADDRAQGWSMVRQEQDQGTCTLAAPLHDPGKGIIAAIGVGWFPVSPEHDRALRERVLPHLLWAAAEIDRATVLGSGLDGIH